MGAEDGGATGLQRLVGDHPIPVQAAWACMIERMVLLGERAGRATHETAAG